jgi:hypothetical protein
MRSFGARARETHIKKLTLSRSTLCNWKNPAARRCCCCRYEYYLLLHARMHNFLSILSHHLMLFILRQGYTTTHTRRSPTDDAISRWQNAKMNVLLKMCIKYVKHLGHDSHQDPLCVHVKKAERLLFFTPLTFPSRRRRRRQPRECKIPNRVHDPLYLLMRVSEREREETRPLADPRFNY